MSDVDTLKYGSEVILRSAALSYYLDNELPLEGHEEAISALDEWMSSHRAELMLLLQRYATPREAVLIVMLDAIIWFSTDTDNHGKIWMDVNLSRIYLGQFISIERIARADKLISEEIACTYRRSFIGRVAALGYIENVQRALNDIPTSSPS